MAALLTKRRLSWRKRGLFAAIVLVVSMLLLEVLSFVGLKLIGPYTIVEMVDERDFLKTAAEALPTHEVIHPYLGWVLDPDLESAEVFEGRRYPVNEFGLVDTHTPLQKRAANKVIVGVIGGSVAWQTTAGGNEALLRELKKQPRFQGREVVLVRLAMNAYKQPQQLLLLTYLLSVGAELDVLVNIDGYNEVVLHGPENGKHHIFPPYPRAWKIRNEIRTDPASLELLLRYRSNKADRTRWAGYCNTLPLQQSATVNFVWKARDNLYFRTMQDALNALVQSRLGNDTYQITGPVTTFRTPDEMSQYLVDYWQRCSRQMERICNVNGIEYHHVLPPNQHLLESKPMTPRERDVALLPSPFSEGAQKTYPLLVRSGAELKADGLRFHDLTQLFQQHNEPIYVDSCCHYNTTGNEMLAIAVAKIVGTVQEAGTPSPK